MNISKVKTAIKVAKIIKCDGNKRRKLQIEWFGNKTLLTANKGRVYLIVVNGKIYKIGGSQAKGGIKGTMKPYIHAALTGAPSIRTYGIHILIREALNKQKKVELYLIQSPEVKIKVPGLFKNVTKSVAPFKEMESQCLHDYIECVGKFPIWNFQESLNAWPIHIQRGCNKIRTNCVTKSKKK